MKSMFRKWGLVQFHYNKSFPQLTQFISYTDKNVKCFFKNSRFKSDSFEHYKGKEWIQFYMDFITSIVSIAQ